MGIGVTPYHRGCVRNVQSRDAVERVEIVVERVAVVDAFPVHIRRGGRIDEREFPVPAEEGLRSGEIRFPCMANLEVSLLDEPIQQLVGPSVRPVSVSSSATT